MSDYHFEAALLRGNLASMLAANEEQFVFVLTNALCCVDFDEAMEAAELGDDVEDDQDRGALILRLRELANAIEEGRIT